MELEIQKLTTDFMIIKDIVTKITDIKTVIKQKLARLKEIHTDFIKNNNSKKYS